MTEIEAVFAEFSPIPLTLQPDGDYQWGTWRIAWAGGAGIWLAVDDSAGVDDNSPWPRRMFHGRNLRELANDLVDAGPEPLTAEQIAALQAEMTAAVVARMNGGAS